MLLFEISSSPFILLHSCNTCFVFLECHVYFVFLVSQRLDIAKEFGDKVAERRSYSNLANASVLKGEYKMAADYYKLDSVLHLL